MDRPARMSCPLELRAIELGRFARRVLRRPVSVIARFERSVYVANTSGIACIGGADLGSGPLNAIVRGFVPPAAVGETVCVALAGARIWKPVPARVRDSRRVGRAVARLEREAGRGMFLIRDFHPSVAALQRWIAAGARARPPADAALLIGSGPGLTPAGDDLIGGALVALRALRRHALAARVGAWALKRARDRTSRISRAHLACAAAGEGGAALHALIGALLSGKRNLAREIAAIDDVGHTSGWDAAAGAVAALKAAGQPRGRRHAA